METIGKRRWKARGVPYIAQNFMNVGPLTAVSVPLKTLRLYSLPGFARAVLNQTLPRGMR